MNINEYHKSLINDYLSEKSNICCKGSIEEYTAEQKCIDEAIRVAVNSKFKDGKTHTHQYRIYNYVYDEFIQNLLLVIKEIKNTKNFDELINVIDTNKPSGAGELFCYDVAIRIGYYIKLLPEKIYIHAGTRKGLIKLFGRKIHEKKILKNDLPEPFKSCELKPDQLEDFFCIYKDKLCGKNENLSSVENLPLPRFCISR